MPETNWGRKETIIWPPHSPIYTFGAVFLALILTGLFVYLRFAFALSPLEQFYLPLYIKTSVAPSLRSSGKYQMLLRQFKVADDKDGGPGGQPFGEQPRLVRPTGGCRSGLDTANECQAHPACAIRLRSPARHDLSLSQRSEHLPKQRSWKLPQAASLQRGKHR